jgi:hypothetical protein
MINLFYSFILNVFVLEKKNRINIWPVHSLTIPATQ